MIFLLLGVITLGVLMGALGMFSRARVADIKAFGVWTAAIGGLAAAALLFLTGRGGLALAGLALLGPMVWSWVMPGRAKAVPGARPAVPRNARMSRAEALEVLGLPPGASEAQIREAYLRLMRAAHPDSGGSDWLAARINQARDTLLEPGLAPGPDPGPGS